MRTRAEDDARFSSEAFTAVLIAGAILAVLGALDATSSRGAVLLALRALPVLAVMVLVRRGVIRQGTAERALYWIVALAVGHRLTLLDMTSPEGAVLTVVTATTIVLTLGLMVSPQQQRFAYVAAALLVCLLPPTLLHADDAPVLFARSGVYLVFIGVMLAVLESQSRRAATNELLAHTDELTKLPNRRSLRHELEHLSRTSDAGGSHAVLMIDLDHFKELNDTEGHAAGDEALQAIGGVLQSMLRDDDRTGRWGGEEFLVLLPDTTVEQGAQIADRIRHAISDAGSVTASVGVAAWVPGERVESWVSRADAALYAAKQGGRDRVRAADESGQGRPAR